MKESSQNAAPFRASPAGIAPIGTPVIILLLASLTTAACTRSAPPKSAVEAQASAPDSERTGADLANTEPLVAEPPSDEPSEAQPESSNEASPAAQVEQICESNCQRMDSACPRSAERCRSSCRDYVAGAAKCPVEIYEALTCQSEAEDFLLCSNVSPEECGALVRGMKACQNGSAAPAIWGKKKAEKKSDGPPADWVRLVHPELGFSILFPPRASWTKVDGHDTASATIVNLNYRATVRSLAGKKVNDGLILRTVVSELGKACEADIRLHGRYETQGTTHIRFNSSCKGEEDYYGVLHIKGDHALLVSIHRQGKFDAPPEDLESLVFGYNVP